MRDPDSISEEVKAFKSISIEDWWPQKSVDIEIRIAVNGDWFYQGSIISRRRMTKLFSTLLRIENSQYYLITPNVKYRILVDDVPFIAVALDTKGEGQQRQLVFRTNMDEEVMIGKDKPLEMLRHSGYDDALPYITVRDHLKAKISRPVFYELAELAQHGLINGGSDKVWGVYGGGEFFPLEAS